MWSRHGGCGYSVWCVSWFTRWSIPSFPEEGEAWKHQFNLVNTLTLNGIFNQLLFQRSTDTLVTFQEKNAEDPLVPTFECGHLHVFLSSAGWQLFCLLWGRKLVTVEVLVDWTEIRHFDFSYRSFCSVAMVHFNQSTVAFQTHIHFSHGEQHQTTLRETPSAQLMSRHLSTFWLHYMMSLYSA